MSTRVVLATRNAHKLVELQRILEQAAVDVELVGTDAFPGLPEIPETGETFAANALLKAHGVARFTGLPAVADDSGLCVDALNGMPGIFSARWSGRHGDDLANLELLLGQVADVPDERLTARFRCAAVLVLPDGSEVVAEGEMAGRLVRAPRGTNGFGYDPIFVPDGQTVTSAELPSDEKDAISHRGRALRALAPQLGAALAAAAPDA